MTSINIHSFTSELPKYLKRASRSELPILLRGPTGSGKEHLARRIHDASARNGPLVPVNMAALAQGLSQSELFGSVRGAFTGAERDRIGLFEAAHGGTILLDEIGDAPPFIQVELLRILETRQVRRLGCNHSKPLDFRVIAATHQPLESLIESGRFRADLYYRLQGIEVTLPALKDAKPDIFTLAETFLESTAPGKFLSSDARDALMHYSWPGNIRELKQTILRAATLAEGREITSGLLQLRSVTPPGLASLGYKTELVGKTYAATGGCLSSTAQTLGLHRSTIHRHLIKWKAAQAFTL